MLEYINQDKTSVRVAPSALHSDPKSSICPKSQFLSKFPFYIFFTYLSISQSCVGIYWSTQNYCTGRTQCTAQWSKIIEICPKSQFLSKFLSKFPKVPFFFLIWEWFKFVLEYIGQNKITVRGAPCALHIGPKLSKFLSKFPFYIFVWLSEYNSSL